MIHRSRTRSYALPAIVTDLNKKPISDGEQRLRQKAAQIVRKISSRDEMAKILKQDVRRSKVT